MRQILVTTLILCGLVLVGCDKEEAGVPASQGGDVQIEPTDPKPAAPAPGDAKTDETVGKVELPDVGKVVDDVAADAGKEVYVGAAEKAMAGWGSKLDGLIAATKAKGGELNESSKKAMADLEQKKEAVKAKLGELKEKSGDAWTEARPHLEEAMDDLQKAYDAATAEFKEEAPTDN